LKDQLRLLEELQRHDAKLQEDEAALKALPEKLKALKDDLGKVEALLLRERQGLADTEKFRRDLEGQVKDTEGGILKAKSKLAQVKGGKDFNAAQREVEATRKMVSDREEELLKLLQAIETTKKSIAIHEGEVNELREVYAREEQATEAKMAEVRARMDAARAGREEAAARVQPAVLKKYSTIRMKRGLAVVPASRGTCHGCHMAIPPQLFNILQRGKTIETCPSCSRIVYWEEIMKDKELERGEAES
jgi:uncharacterized protein